MDNAQALFRDGVMAFKEGGDPARARQLLSQSLKLEPNNEMAWLWLARTTDDRARQLQCVERALKINPDNPQAQTLYAKLSAGTANAAPPLAAPSVTRTAVFYEQEPAPAVRTPVFYPEPEPVRALEPVRDLISEEALEIDGAIKTQRDTLTADEERQIAKYLATADARLAAEDDEGAIEAWLYALQIQIDHPTAIPKIVRQLHKMKYTEDAQEVLQRAIDAETPSLAIYLTAIDVNKMLGNYARLDALREAVVMMEAADDSVVLKIIDSLLADIQQGKAIELLEKAIAVRPSHDLHMKLGEVYEEQGRKALAMAQYEKAARVSDAKGRKRADKTLATFTPVITDAERGSVPLALREAAGVGTAFLFLAWQDSGLNLTRMSPQHWLGIGLSLVGGYCVVTAFSSPQQRGLAAALGGVVPDAPEGGSFTQHVEIKPWEDNLALPTGPMQDATQLPILPSWARGLFAIIGIAVLALAFYLSFGRSIALLRNPVPPELPSIFDFIIEDEPVE
ncbi:MAG: tetratricopeptide repeat protein [Chloroflexota bacterium]|nr:tetratricopeptide repeat protein [Chloroflexota bacterium]